MTKIIGIFKSIFSRLFLIALTVILQVAVIVYFAFKLTNDYLYFQIISTIIGIIVFVVVINRRIHPEHKLMWSVLMLLVPIFGVTLFILLDINKPTKKRIKKFTQYDKDLLNNENEYKKEVLNIAKKYEGQINYLENMSSMNAYKNTHCTYLKDGNAFYDSLINDLKNAKKFIFMEYFIIRPGKMWDSILEVLKQKVQEGVEVRFIYDDVGSAKYVRGNYYKKLQNYGINCCKFGTMIPLISSYHNNRDHRKITIIDGYIGYTGGINLGDEYINITSPFGYWKDNAVKLVGEGVNNLTILFLQNFSISTLKVLDYSPYFYKKEEHNIEECDEIVIPFGTGPSHLYYDNMAVDVILNLISQAQKYIDITTPYLIIDYSLTNALISAAARGVRVRILIPSKPDKRIIYAFAKQNALELLNKGIEIYFYTPGFNHAKSILVDDEVAYVGTTNLDFRSLLHHYECGVWIYNSPCLKQIDENFENDYLHSKRVNANDLKTSIFTKIILSVLKLFQSLL